MSIEAWAICGEDGEPVVLFLRSSRFTALVGRLNLYGIGMDHPEADEYPIRKVRIEIVEEGE